MSSSYCGPLPVRTSPMPDELISSWLMRLANANAVTRSTLVREIIGLDQLQQFSESCGAKVQARLSSLSNLSEQQVASLFFRDEISRVPGFYLKDQSTLTYGWLSFHQPLRPGHGFTPCTYCWEEDETPYIRRCWRENFFTICPHHKKPLQQRCDGCGERFSSSLASSLALPYYFGSPLSVCRRCAVDARCARTHTAPAGDEELDKTLLLESLLHEVFSQGAFSICDADLIGKLLVRHQDRRYPVFEEAILKRRRSKLWPSSPFNRRYTDPEHERRLQGRTYSKPWQG